MDIPYSIETTLDRFEDDRAVFRTADGQEITWPSEQVPDDLEEGSLVRLAIMTDEDATGHRQAMAHDILNEILSGDGEEE